MTQLMGLSLEAELEYRRAALLQIGTRVSRVGRRSRRAARAQRTAARSTRTVTPPRAA
jgi:hypothetical protein